MRVAIRADSSPSIGTGHVMRCLTLAEGLLEQGHTVAMFTTHITVSWLHNLISQQGIELHYVEESSLSMEQLFEFRPDWVVIDSYDISSKEISTLTKSVKTLAIVDMDSRGIEADLYLDQNFNSENLNWSKSIQTKVLAGSQYSMIRNDIQGSRRLEPWKFNLITPHVLCVMGGSDPTGTIVPICEALNRIDSEFTATVVCSPQWRNEVDKRTKGNLRITVIEPTIEMGALYLQSDIVVSAAGSSAWEICTLGIPSLLIAVADNQQQPLIQIKKAKLALTLDRFSTDDGADEFIQAICDSLELLLHDETLREELSRTSLKLFDGEGTKRVVQAMENHA